MTAPVTFQSILEAVRQKEKEPPTGDDAPLRSSFHEQVGWGRLAVADYTLQELLLGSNEFADFVHEKLSDSSKGIMDQSRPNIVGFCLFRKSWKRKGSMIALTKDIAESPPLYGIGLFDIIWQPTTGFRMKEATHFSATMSRYLETLSDRTTFMSVVAETFDAPA